MQVAILIWWAVSARKWFKGPKVNLEHLMLGREEQAEVLEGKAGDSESDSGVPGDKQVGDFKPEKL